MGANDAPHLEDGEAPERQVFVDFFEISTTAVTNQQFDMFIRDTGYVTIAERQNWSFVFHLLVDDEIEPDELVAHAPWWCKVSGANWATPFGGGSSWRDIPDHPVTHICLLDALAYCDWAKLDLPSEAQWEFAARGGLERQPYPWGSNLQPGGKHMSNVWRGDFPDKPANRQKFTGAVTVDAFEPNAWGLYNMCGNVWEWTQDRFTHLHGSRPSKNPTGPLNGDRYVAKGGSYLCHHSYCTRYRTSSRQALDPLTLTGNVGFRVVRQT